MVSHNMTEVGGIDFGHGVSIGRSNRSREANSRRIRMLSKKKQTLRSNKPLRLLRDPSLVLRSNSEGDNNKTGWTSAWLFLSIMRKSR
ncbi:MAG: hypothetical protein HW412_535 [Bacteroidetes bacterium]|nr:hypothetical protein [Bacteroidota bacterium]